MKRQVTESDKAIAKYVLKIFGGTPKVFAHGDEYEKSFIDILKCTERPQEGLISYSTLGLSNFPLYIDGNEYPVRIEILGVCKNKYKEFENAIATSAFCIINSRWPCYPGTIFNNVLKMYKLSKTLDHLLFVPPFIWDDQFQNFTIDNKTIAWLLAVPISTKEMEFADQYGSEKLEELLESQEIDIADLERKSVV